MACPNFSSTGPSNRKRLWQYRRLLNFSGLEDIQSLTSSHCYLSILYILQLFPPADCYFSGGFNVIFIIQYLSRKLHLLMEASVRILYTKFILLLLFYCFARKYPLCILTQNLFSFPSSFSRSPWYGISNGITARLSSRLILRSDFAEQQENSIRSWFFTAAAHRNTKGLWPWFPFFSRYAIHSLTQ